MALAALVALALPATAVDKEKVNVPVRERAADKRFEKLGDDMKEARVSHVAELPAEWGEFADAHHQDQVLRWVFDFLDKEEGFARVLGYQPFKKLGHRGVKSTGANTRPPSS